MRGPVVSTNESSRSSELQTQTATASMSALATLSNGRRPTRQARASARALPLASMYAGARRSARPASLARCSCASHRTRVLRPPGSSARVHIARCPPADARIRSRSDPTFARVGFVSRHAVSRSRRAPRSRCRRRRPTGCSCWRLASLPAWRSSRCPALHDRPRGRSCRSRCAAEVTHSTFPNFAWSVHAADRAHMHSAFIRAAG